MAHTNRLSRETSPYLQQHAHNPVDWYPWGEEALDKARQEDKPILLSIGYSACHWCHVMAHESFEDEATAQVMNENFVNIKVDREERPDLDKIYQLAHQLLTQRPGGWPLTMMLTPDQVPFFGGTYFPKTPRYGMPAFTDLLDKVAAFYHQNRGDVNTQNQQLQRVLAELAPGHNVHQGDLDPQPLDTARRQLEQHFDPVHGGFGDAPKFPHPTNVERLLRHWAATRDGGTGDQRARELALTTLRKMAQGGIYDQISGGFCRYSVDDQWMIPHFEKMLYDNGPLLALYSQAWQVSPEPLFKRAAEQTAQWVMREMQSPEGGYYSTLDADSEGEEGKFYTWTQDELETLLDNDELRAASRHWGFDQPANFEGRWHLHVYQDAAAVARELDITEAQADQLLDRARHKLFAARDQRIRPGRDEKILSAWNGLMIKGMAVAGRVFGRDDFVQSAVQALDFVRQHLWQQGKLLAVHKDGKSRLNAYLDDYAFLLDGTLELLQSRWDDDHLDFAVTLANDLVDRYSDTERGGFFFTAHDHEQLIHRPKAFGDDSLPSGNGVAAYALARLGHVLAETRYLDAAEQTLRAAWPHVSELPFAHNAMLNALEEHLYPPQLIFIRGAATQACRWHEAVTRTYKPRRLAFAISAGGERLPGAIATAPERGVLAYRCDGYACSAPVTDLQQLEKEIG